MYYIVTLVRPCNCQEGGSKSLQCHLNTGICTCKANAEGRKCELCKSGTYNSDPQNPDGCSPCFCFGRSSGCSSAKNFVKSVIRSQFSAAENIDERGELIFADFSPSYNISFGTNSSVNFTFEKKFQGDQLRSYGQFFTMTMNYANQTSLDSSWSVKLTGANGKVAIFGILPAPSLSNTDYHAQLHERYSITNLTAYELQSILAALDSVILQGSFKAHGSVRITNGVQLVTAVEGVGEEVGYVENCSCSNNYTQLSCGFCNQGNYENISPRIVFIVGGVVAQWFISALDLALGMFSQFVKLSACSFSEYFSPPQALLAKICFSATGLTFLAPVCCVRATIAPKTVFLRMEPVITAVWAPKGLTVRDASPALITGRTVPSVHRGSTA